MPRVDACSQMTCDHSGEKCVPLFWDCRRILGTGFIVDRKDGQLYCPECKAKQVPIRGCKVLGMPKHQDGCARFNLGRK
jgi:hypothetical protein